MSTDKSDRKTFFQGHKILCPCFFFAYFAATNHRPLYKDYFLYALPLIVLLTNRIPYVGKFLRIVNTLIHESGHAFVALLSSGEVYEVELFSDRSGTATTKTKGKFSRFLVALAGYPFGSAFAWLMCYFISQNNIDWVLYILICIALVNLALMVRNTFGIFWLIAFVMVLIVVIYYANADVKYYFSLWLAGIMLFEAFYSSIELLLIAAKKPKSAGDAANLQSFTGIPALLWALLFVAQSGFFIYLSVKLFFVF